MWRAALPPAVLVFSACVLVASAEAEDRTALKDRAVRSVQAGDLTAVFVDLAGTPARLPPSRRAP